MDDDPNTNTQVNDAQVQYINVTPLPDEASDAVPNQKIYTTNVPILSTDQFATVVSELIAIANAEESKSDGDQQTDGGEVISFEQSADQQGDGGGEMSEQSPDPVVADDRETSSIQPKIVCDKCGRTFFSKTGYREHVDVIHNKIVCTCNICGVTMKYASNLKVHMRVVHKISEPILKKKFNRECPQCKKKFKSNFLMYHHLQTVHGVAKPYECHVCQAKFRSNNELSGHQNIHPELAPYACNICPFRYKTKLTLEKHQKKFGHYDKPDHDEVQKPKADTLQCLKCKEVFPTNQKYVSHVGKFDSRCSRNDHDKRHVCKCCGEVFKTQSKLGIHFSENHKEFKTVGSSYNVKKPCPVCNKLLNSSGIEYHAKMHAGIRPFKCDLCDHRTIIAKDLLKHKRMIHEKLRDYPCQICCRQFRSKADLLAHHDLHVGIARFKCSECHKGYMDRSACNDHQKICKLGKASFVPKNLKDVVGYRCRWCCGLFSTAGSYSHHRKSCDLKDNEEDCRVPEKQELEKALDDILLLSGYEEYSDGKSKLTRPDLLPWCKICGGLFVNKAAYKSHSYHCTSMKTMKKKERRQKRVQEEKCENGDEGSKEDMDTKEQIIETPEPDQSALDKPDQSVVTPKQEQSDLVKSESNQSVLDKPQAEQPVLDISPPEQDVPETPQPDQSVCNTRQTRSSVRNALQTRSSVRNTMQTRSQFETRKVFSPFSYSCGVCHDVTEELIKEFCSEHYMFCSYCSEVLKYDADVRLHLQGHLVNEEKPQLDDQLVCKTCRKTTEELIQAHIRRHPYHCLKCLLAFDSIKKLGKHAKEHKVEGGNFPCDKCDSVFTQMTKLNAHARQCQQPDLVFLNKGKVKYNKLVCQYCPVKFKNKTDRNIHEQSAHDHGTVYKCCGTDFNTLDKYKKHQTSKRHMRFVNRCVNKPSEARDGEDVEMNTDDDEEVVKSEDKQVHDNAGSTEGDVVFQIVSPSPESQDNNSETIEYMEHDADHSVTHAEALPELVESNIKQTVHPKKVKKQVFVIIKEDRIDVSKVLASLATTSTAPTDVAEVVHVEADTVSSDKVQVDTEIEVISTSTNDSVQDESMVSVASTCDVSEEVEL